MGGDAKGRGDIIDSRSGVIRLRARIGRRRFIQGAAALGGLAAIGAAPLPAGAATSVRFVGFPEYEAALAPYMKAHGIAARSSYVGGSADILNRLSTGGVGAVDLVTPYAGYVPLLVAAGLLAPIDEALVPSLARVHPLFKDNAILLHDGRLYAAPFVWGGVPMMYDPAAIAVPPTSWWNVLKPEYRGRVGMIRSLNNILLASIIVNKAEVPSRLTLDELGAAVDLLIRIKASARLVAASYDELADAMARGEVAITFGGWEAMKQMAADKGKRIDCAYPTEGTFGWLDTYCVVRDAPNPAVAHALINAALDAPAQLKAGRDGLLGIVNRDAIAKLDPARRALYPYDDLDGFGRRAGFYPIEPLTPDGRNATFDDWARAYERFERA